MAVPNVYRKAYDQSRCNNSAPELIEQAIRRGEGVLTASGALAVETGQHTGRSASDKFIVADDETRSRIWWENTSAITVEQFDRLLADFSMYADGRELFIQDLFAGADPRHQLPARLITEYAWHALFIRHLLRRPEKDQLETFEPQFTVISLSPDFVPHRKLMAPGPKPLSPAISPAASCS